MAKLTVTVRVEYPVEEMGLIIQRQDCFNLDTTLERRDREIIVDAITEYVFNHRTEFVSIHLDLDGGQHDVFAMIDGIENNNIVCRIYDNEQCSHSPIVSYSYRSFLWSAIDYSYKRICAEMAEYLDD